MTGTEKGLQGCGKGTTLGIVHCALAPALCNAAGLATGTQDILAGWQDAVCHHLTHDPTQQIGHRHLKPATSVTEAFPEEGVVVSYIHPMVSAAMALPAIREPQAPDVTALGALVQQQLGWDDPQHLLNTFSQHVWPVVVMQEILRDLKVTTVAPPTPCRLSAVLSAASHSHGTKHVINGIEGVNLQVPTRALSVDTLASHSSIQKACEDGMQAQRDLGVWIPQPVYGAWVGLTSHLHSSSPTLLLLVRVAAKISVHAVQQHNNLPHHCHCSCLASRSQAHLLSPKRTSLATTPL